MIKLHQETTAGISSLINRMNVCQMMADDSSGTNTFYWMAEEYRAIVKMFDQFGIELACYNHAKENLEREYYRDAFLTSTERF